MEPVFLLAVGVIIMVCVVVGARARRRPTVASQPPAALLAPPARIATDLTPLAQRNIAEQIALGQKIMAIKMYRDATGVGLKEAKDAVELWADQGTPVPASGLPTSGVADSPAVEGQNPYGPLPGSENADGGSQDQWPQLPPTNRT